MQFSLVSFYAAFDPFNITVLAMTYTLDVLFVLDICASIMNAYRTDIRNVELRKGNSRLDDYLKSWFLLDILALVPTDVISILYTDASSQYIQLPYLGYARINRIISGYKIIRVSSNTKERLSGVMHLRT